MKSLKFIALGLAALMVASLVSSCSMKKSYPEVDFVSLKGTVDSVLAGQMIYLVDPVTMDAEDSTQVDPTLHFAFADLSRYKEQSSVKLLRADYVIGTYHLDLMMPVVVEKGDIHVLFGENQAMMGSQLNDELNNFLLKLNYFVELAKEQTPEKARKAFSDYLKEFVSVNENNALGIYVKRAYADKMQS